MHMSTLSQKNMHTSKLSQKLSKSPQKTDTASTSGAVARVHTHIILYVHRGDFGSELEPGIKPVLLY